ncbi:exodeoxyribonuclease VII small subunit [Vagococcus fluvialis]|jgi:exodeoxyribonuclease VII small subunit|uniref:Exodeoxyribonuclease 7 small subunit n=1 Tax=Vagococcus fluvialis TaxID=2738 RepID=A0A369AWJ8_9ENTE|nr:exodeoxyribonuclease VII small subunit [Vagococcus fluvialis]MDR2276237.1 exodeoxyribonuclease VII small subunit [Vagococcus sp.]OTP33940.1 exodeoxyribonuclease VII, small subunit [Enterococcus sp. 6C8_DIV0013]MBO0419642.1 exodeoxyribonuclease VII small subunit [Vagococcus fluvialis]MBO0429669.1 exodeoxyribonuclease VII small subunit [Vagococcus fluvialis]MBO0437778.1 exodeoxyribonuclease VII small subunit [Vagococcus fluvialis]
MAKEKKQTFEEAMTDLEIIVKQLETGEVPLEEALEQFKKGMELSKMCQETLTKAEETLTKIMSDDGIEIPFEEAGE